MILGGFIALIGGGELLVRGATSLALAARVSPLVIGLTVVAFGTSAPELGVSIQSCATGATELAIGNAVGSNISNVLLVLGASAIAAPLAVHSRLFKLDIPVMVATAAVLWLMGADGQLSRMEGVVLVAAMIAYFFWTVRTGRKEQKQLESELGVLPNTASTKPTDLAIAAAQVLIGLALLVGGANYLVEGCVQLAAYFGVSELVIGLTVTAIGTSLPELVTSFMAALRGQRDLAVGNVVGSNILNIVCVLGISAVVAPNSIGVTPDAKLFHMPVMLAVSVCCLPVFLTGSEIARWEGFAMLGYYIAYLAYVSYSASTTPVAVPTVTTTILFVLPLIALTFVSLFAAKRSR
ncbi:MAG: calcium/sodium antiporter [Planctomycetota bacterium]